MRWSNIGGMQEFSSVTASSYDADSLAPMLAEKSAEGWSVISIVAAGTNIVAYLEREADESAAEVVEETAEPATASEIAASFQSVRSCSSRVRRSPEESRRAAVREFCSSMSASRERTSASVGISSPRSLPSRIASARRGRRSGDSPPVAE